MQKNLEIDSNIALRLATEEKKVHLNILPWQQPRVVAGIWQRENKRRHLVCDVNSLRKHQISPGGGVESRLMMHQIIRYQTLRRTCENCALGILVGILKYIYFGRTIIMKR